MHSTRNLNSANKLNEILTIRDIDCKSSPLTVSVYAKVELFGEICQILYLFLRYVFVVHGQIPKNVG